MTTPWKRPPIIPTAPMDWENAAACLGQPELMFTEQIAAVRRAAALCAECPVISQCWELSERVSPTSGVWAGRKWRHNKGPQNVDIWCSVPGCMGFLFARGMCKRCTERTRKQHKRLLREAS